MERPPTGSLDYACLTHCQSPRRQKHPAAIAIDKQLLSASNDGVFLPVQKVDFGWLLCRMNITEESILLPVPRTAGIQTVPGWTGFNAQLQYDTVPTLSSIGYLPVVDASPTEYPFVNTVLKQALDTAEKLNQ